VGKGAAGPPLKKASDTAAKKTDPIEDAVAKKAAEDKAKVEAEIKKEKEMVEKRAADEKAKLDAEAKKTKDELDKKVAEEKAKVCISLSTFGPGEVPLSG